MVGGGQLVIQDNTERCDIVNKHGGGSIAGLLCAPGPVNIVSLDFVQFNYRLLFSAQVSTCDSARSQVDELAAAWYDYVSVVSKLNEHISLMYGLKVRHCDDE